MLPTGGSEEAERSARARRAQATPKKQEAVLDVSTDIDSDPSDSEEPSTKSPSKRPPPKRASYATPTGPAYQARISALDAEQRLFEEERAKRVRQEHAKAHVQVVTLRWWTVVRVPFMFPDIKLTSFWFPEWGRAGSGGDRRRQPVCISSEGHPSARRRLPV